MHFSNWFHSSSPSSDAANSNTKPASAPADAPQVFDTTDAQGIGRAGVRDSLIIPNANALQCFQVVANVAQYPSFLSIYNSVNVVSEATSPDQMVNERIAKYSIHTPLILHPFLKSVDYTLRLISTHHPNGVYTMTWQQTEGPSFIVENIGKWTISQRGQDVVMELEMSLGYSFYLPSNLKTMIQTHMVRDTLNSIRDRAIQVQKKSF